MRPLVIVLLAAACSSESAAPSDVVELDTSLLEGIEPGADVMLCTYLDYRAPADLDLIHAEAVQSEFGHHALLFGARASRPVGTHICTEDDMVNVRYLAGHGGEGGASLPVRDDLAFRIHEGQQLMIQTHWINTGEAAISGRASFRVTLRPPSAERMPADLFTVVGTRFSIPPGAGAATVECRLPVDLELVMLGGHAHERGTRVSIARGEEVLYDEAWSEHSVFDPPLVEWEVADPLRIAAGEVLRVECEYHNETADPIGFPTEMCALFGYWFPADREIDCVDGNWPSSP